MIVQAIAYSGRADWKDLLARFAPRIPTRQLMIQKYLDGRLPTRDSILVVSGRAGYEIVQKSITAGIPILAAVGAPSSLAVALSREFNQTLVGFLRGERFNVYAAPKRLAR